MTEPGGVAGPASPDAILAEQRSYYEARAGEYDDWWLRRGRFDAGPEANARWRAEADEVTAALAAVDVSGDVLELAPGTGTWSRLLQPRARTLTLVDASPAMLAENPVVGLPSVRTVEADLFGWDPGRTFDVVAFGFWLSHVPDELLDPFLARLASWLAPGGRVFLVDSAPGSGPSPAHVLTVDGETVVRSLADGSRWRIVKVNRPAPVLEERFGRVGIPLVVRQTPTFFQYATGVRAG